MAILVKKEILKMVADGEIGFSPELDKFQVQAHSVDLRLGYTFIIHKSWSVTNAGREAVSIDALKAKKDARFFDVVELEEGQFFDLLPGEYVTVASLETIKVPNNLMAVLYPRSSVNRRGVSVDLTGIVDAGYEGQLIIPMRNNTAQVVRLYPGERFCQIVFEALDEPGVVRKSRHHLKDVVDAPEREDSTEIDLVTSGKILEIKSKHKQDLSV